jgi:hypothetical protein
MPAAGEQRRAVKAGGLIVLAFDNVGSGDMAAVDAKDPIVGHRVPALSIPKENETTAFGRKL